MKRPSLAFFTLLAATCAAHAQTATPPAAANTKPDVRATLVAGAGRIDSNGTLTLMPGTLPEMVAQVETAVPDMITLGQKDSAMPNVIYAPGAEEISVPAPLRLRQVSPVQALTLVAAAAGCTLEPIIDASHTPSGADPFSPGSPADGSRVIGYRFTLPPRLVRSPNSALRTSSNIEPQVLSHPPKTAATDPRPNFITSTGGGITWDGEKVKYMDLTGGGLITTTAPMRPGENTSVRVYALGAVLRGDQKEVVIQERDLQELVAEALAHAKLDKENPILSFHSATKALIVKGTDAQHVIVEQIIQAMKENATVPAGAGSRQ